jgi:creatinine amidohydrolase
MERRLEALTYPRIQEHIQNGRNTAVLPIGAVEQHGPHCPLGTDAFIARAVSRTRFAFPRNGSAYPPTTWVFPEPSTCGRPH